jgi:hypothetical protein
MLSEPGRRKKDHLKKPGVQKKYIPGSTGIFPAGHHQALSDTVFLLFLTIFLSSSGIGGGAGSPEI